MIKNIVFILAFFPAYVMASSFIECEVIGEVVSSPKDIELSGEEYLVFDLTAITVKDVGSYTVEDCNQFYTGAHEVRLNKDQVPSAKLKSGDIVTVKYSYVDWVDSSTPRKYRGTAVWQFMSYD